MKKILITGGAGFIGSALVNKLMIKKQYKILNIDKLTYSNMIKFQPHLKKDSINYKFKKIDISSNKLKQIIDNFKPDTIFNLAAESHVDNSIINSKIFIQSNILGTYNLLESVKKFWKKNDFFKKN
ncbi:uncharacterized protein METZ01_LOCUS325721, partial [marine metagenome]